MATPWISRGSLASCSRAKNVDGLREGVRVLAQSLMETEMVALVGAQRRERSDERTICRHGTRICSWNGRVRLVDLAILKIRPGRC